MTNEKEETVCLDLMALYDHTEKKKGSHPDSYSDNAVEVDLGFNVIRKDGDYYDLFRNKNSSVMLCCDGEQCKVLKRTDEYVTLIDVENIDNDELEEIDTTFTLSVEEFKIATGGAE